MAQLKPAAKFTLIAIVTAIVVFGGRFLLNSGLIPGESNSSSNRPVTVERADGSTVKIQPINVCVVTWGGYIGGQYFNEGFNASQNSRYYQEYGILVNFEVNDDFFSSREAWKADECDLLWMTYDSYTTEVPGLVSAGYSPVGVFQADWSRGGDAIVAAFGINTVADLRGKSVAVAFGTPSHTYLLAQLESSGMTVNDIAVVEVPSAIDAASAFKAGRVDAAVVWSPDDQLSVEARGGSKVLSSTKDATHIIADGFYAKKEWVDEHLTELTSLIEGWMIGASEINSSSQAKEEAVRILAVGLGLSDDEARNAINNVRLATYGDNVEFFKLGAGAGQSAVTGEDLYNRSGRMYIQQTNLIDGNLPSWRQVVDTRALRNVSLSASGAHASENSFRFTEATPEMRDAPAFSSRSLSVTFPTGSCTLDENAKALIEMTFVPTAKTFASSRIRIEGNTDDTGSREVNMRISRCRAEALRNFLVDDFGFDRNRFIIVGNGPDNPVAPNSTPEGRAQNRRTDFELIRS